VKEVSKATWRNRFILVNLVTISGTILALFGILLWQTDYVVQGGSVLGFGLAMIGLVISFFAPRLMAKRWKRGGGA
jgi:phosphatidylserine synthase